MPPLVAFVAGAIVGAALIVIVAVLDSQRKVRKAPEPQKVCPDGYWPCINWATCGWWYKQFMGCNICNHCWAAGDEGGLKDCEEDPQLGPDWRPSCDPYQPGRPQHERL